MQAWRRAADALAEMALYVRAEEFYTVAMRLDPSMAELLRPTIERIRLQARVPGRNELLR